MFFSRRKLGVVAAALLVLGSLLLGACGSASSPSGTAPTSTPPSVATTGSTSTMLGHSDFTTSTTLLFPSQKLFMQELSGDGYQTAIVSTDWGEGRILTIVWIAVDPDKVASETHDAIFEQAVTLAKKYGAADTTEGRLRVELFDSTHGGSIKDLTIDSRDFDLAATDGSTAVDPSDGARVVQDYFAAEGGRFVQGILVKNVRVNDESRGRTLSLTFAIDTSGQGGSFDSLYYGSVGEDGWTAELNQTGLDLALVRMEFVYQDGFSETLVVDIAGRDIAGHTRLRPGPPTTRP